MNKKAIIITVSSILLLGAGVGVFMYYNNKNKKKSESEKEEYGETEKAMADLGGEVVTPDETEYSGKTKIKGDTFPLKNGSNGRNVAMLQALLNYNEGAGLTIDGAFGNATRQALIKSGFLSCMSTGNTALDLLRKCTVTKEDFTKITVARKDPAEFKKLYNVNNNPSIKKVWDKYSS